MNYDLPQISADAPAHGSAPDVSQPVRQPSFDAPQIGVETAIAHQPKSTFLVPAVSFDPVWQPSEDGYLVPDARPHPYVGYGKRFTEEGGIELSYTVLDPSLWQKFLRFISWCTATYAAGHVFHNALNADSAGWLTLGAAILFYFLICGPRHLVHTIEIRPDCLILDGEDVFWADFMELGPPEFKWDEAGETATIGVTYGNRWVEIGSTNRVDPNDRTPQLLQANLNAAYAQLWNAR